MNIFRPQNPYVFRPPIYSRPWAAFLKQLSYHYHLGRRFKIKRIHVEGADRLGQLSAEKHPLLVAPNHADHADPHVVVYAGRQCGVNFNFMAAREAFEVSRLGGYALQRMGVFSIDREGVDLASVKMAMEILKKGDFPLVIFPEGEIYHHHEKLDLLNEGAATFLLRTAARLKDERRCHIVPTAIRYVRDESVKETFMARIEALEASVTWKPRPYKDFVDRIYHLGGGLLALKEQEFLGRSLSGALAERIKAFQVALVEKIEAKHERSPSGEHIPERVKALRGHIRKILTDESANLVEKETWELYDDLDALFLAVQLYSYPGQYLREQPTHNRIAETLLKLEEDVLGEGQYTASGEAYIKFDEPIAVDDFLARHSLDHKTAVSPLTQHVGERIQSMLEAI